MNLFVTLYEDLQREGYECTLDVKDFDAGDELSYVIPDNIDHCDVFIIILSQKYSKSGWCCAELKHAKYCQKKLMIIKRQDCEISTQVQFLIEDRLYLYQR